MSSVSNILGRFASWAWRQLVSADPWEPRIGPGQFLVRERAVGEVLPEGVPLAVLSSPEQVVSYIAVAQLERFWLTANVGGDYETADERDAERLLGEASAYRVIRSYQFSEPAMSPGEVAAVLLEREARAA